MIRTRQAAVSNVVGSSVSQSATRVDPTAAKETSSRQEVTQQPGKNAGQDAVSSYVPVSGSLLAGTLRIKTERGSATAPVKHQAHAVQLSSRSQAAFDVGLPPIHGEQFKLSPRGYFVLGHEVADLRSERDRLTLYRAGEALAQSGVSLAQVPMHVKKRMLNFQKKALHMAREGGHLDADAALAVRSGVASTLLGLIKGCRGGSGEMNVRSQAIDAYLAAAGAERNAGLSASMIRNAETVRSMLSPEQVQALDALKGTLVKTRPPYEAWFAANGAREVHVAHYAQDSFFEGLANPVKYYKMKGFTVVQEEPDAQPPHWRLEKENPNAPGGSVKATVDLFKTRTGILAKMDDPHTNVVIMALHSELGGNLEEEIRNGAPGGGRDKLVLASACRSNQTHFELVQKYPEAHAIATRAPTKVSSAAMVAAALVDGLTSLGDYGAIKATVPRLADEFRQDNYVFPHEVNGAVDADTDGLLDAKDGRLDPHFDVALADSGGKAADLTVRAVEPDPQSLEGTPILHATQFLNTLVTYHLEHAKGPSGLGPELKDAFIGGGWHGGGSGSPRVLLRPVPAPAEGQPGWEVSVHPGLADQHPHALGALVQFEVVKQLLEQKAGGPLTRAQEAWPMLCAGKYLASMLDCPAPLAEEIITRLAKGTTGLGQVTWSQVKSALESDPGGHVTEKQAQALLGTA